MNVWRASTFGSQQSGACNVLNHQRQTSAYDDNLDLNHIACYEQSLPGQAYITASIERLQPGRYASPAIREEIDSVAFVALSFVLHPSRSLNNRFRAATIKVNLRHHPEVYNWSRASSRPKSVAGSLSEKRLSRSYSPSSSSPHRKPLNAPRFLRHAPHLIYGSPSEETMQWYVGLAASLGATQLPVTASVNPSGNLTGSYKFSEMMRVQGSCRAHRSDRGVLENGQLVWSLEENTLQKSGLPREFTFVALVEKTPGRKILMDIEVEPELASWLSHYPVWWSRLPKYRPTRTAIDLDQEVGEPFKSKHTHADDDNDEVEPPFNFAELQDDFEDFVRMPGTTWFTNQPSGTTSDKAAAAATQVAAQGPPALGPSSSARTTAAVPSSSSHASSAPHHHSHKPAPTGQPLNVQLFVDSGSWSRAMSPLKSHLNHSASTPKTPVLQHPLSHLKAKKDAKAEAWHEKF